MSGHRCEGGPLDGWHVEDVKFVNVPMEHGVMRGRYVYSTLGVIKWNDAPVSNDQVHIRPVNPQTTTT